MAVFDCYGFSLVVVGGLPIYLYVYHCHIVSTVNDVLERLRKRKAPEQELSDKVAALNRSVMEVQKYELLTTNQYLQQMEILVSIIQDLQGLVEYH